MRGRPEGDRADAGVSRPARLRCRPSIGPGPVCALWGRDAGQHPARNRDHRARRTHRVGLISEIDALIDLTGGSVMSEILQWAAAIVVLIAFGLSQWGVWS